jgi:hypothetical protein
MKGKTLGVRSPNIGSNVSYNLAIIKRIKKTGLELEFEFLEKYRPIKKKRITTRELASSEFVTGKPKKLNISSALMLTCSICVFVFFFYQAIHVIHR